VCSYVATVLTIDVVPNGMALTSIVTTARSESWSQLLGTPLGRILTPIALSPFPSPLLGG